MHERKYKIEDNRLVKRDTGVPVPPDEPLFILRAKDKNALPILVAYHTLCNHLEHKAAITKNIKDFQEFQKNNPDKMAEPDS